MVEACIGLALLVFVWIAVSFATYMSTNHIRTAMAARHAVWMKGNEGDPTVEKIDAAFFYGALSNNLLTLDIQPGRGSILGNVDAGSSSEADLLMHHGADYSMQNGANWVEVGFGMPSDEVEGTDVFPFSLLKVQLPFLPPSRMDCFLSVKSHCQWASQMTGEWGTWGEALHGIWDAITGAVGDIVGGLIDMFH